MLFISIAPLLFLIICVISYEKKITPFTVLSVPFLFIALISIFSSISLDFIEFDLFIIYLWIICLIFFYIGGRVGLSIINQIKIESIAYKSSGYILIFLFSTILSLILLYNSVSIALDHPNPIYISTDEYATEISSGIYEWIRTFNMIFLVYLIGNISIRKVIFIIPITIIILNLLIFQIKGMLLMPVLAGIMYRLIFQNDNLKFINIFYIGITGIFFVFLIYSLPFLFSGQYDYVFSSDFISNVINKVFGFLNAGILGFSAFYNSNIIISDHQSLQIIAPFMNILRHIVGWERYVIEMAPLSINDAEMIYSNVGTIFGTFYLHTNFFFTCLFAFFVGFLSYCLMQISVKSKNSWARVMHVNLLSILFFGWFEYYFWHQYIISIFIILSIFSVISRLKEIIKI